jgi:hypothetical protein
MCSVPKLTMDIKRTWAMEPTRDNIKELNDYILLRLPLVVDVYRDKTGFLVKTAIFLAFFMI